MNEPARSAPPGAPAAPESLLGPEPAWDGREPEPKDWPVLVTGAGGFVGGHVARSLAALGHRVRGLARRAPIVAPGDPDVEWIFGDVRDAAVRRRALKGVRGIVHAAGWVCLGKDPDGLGRSINVEATRSLLADAAAAGVERFVHTSTIYTLAAGGADGPADELSAWNLEQVASPYAHSKREAERLVLEAGARGDGGFSTIALCPGMVMGPRDPKPTSTALARGIARHRIATLPGGGIPIVDVEVLATAHRRALVAGGNALRYAVVGPYLSYPELAALVRQIVGRPRWIVPVPDCFEPALARGAEWMARLPWLKRRWPDMSRHLVAGGFLRLRVRGDRADVRFGLVHPSAIETIARSLEFPGA